MACSLCILRSLNIIHVTYIAFEKLIWNDSVCLFSDNFIYYVNCTHSLVLQFVTFDPSISKILWTNFQPFKPLVVSESHHRGSICNDFHNRCTDGEENKKVWLSVLRPISKHSFCCHRHLITRPRVVVFLRHRGVYRWQRTIPECPGMNYSPSSACLRAVGCGSSSPVTLTCPRWPGPWLLWSQKRLEVS